MGWVSLPVGLVEEEEESDEGWLDIGAKDEVTEDVREGPMTGAPLSGLSESLFRSMLAI